jgi:hypothetical protein
MADSAVQEPEYHCDDCKFLDDEPVPRECRKGYGQAAYLYKPCGNFQLRIQAEEI